MPFRDERDVKDALQSMVGKVLEEVWLSGDDRVTFVVRPVYSYSHTPAEDISFRLYGDCCSETWFADIEGIQNILHSVLSGAELVDLPNPKDDRGRQEFDEAYSIKLWSARGIADFIFRNSSNGYYGGEVCCTDGRGPSARRLTDDFHA